MLRGFGAFSWLASENMRKPYMLKIASFVPDGPEARNLSEQQNKLIAEWHWPYDYWGRMQGNKIIVICVRKFNTFGAVAKTQWLNIWVKLQKF